MIEDNKDRIEIHTDIPPIHPVDDDDNIMRTCCGKMSDRRLLAFIAGISLSSIVTIFSCYQLTQGLSCSQETTYISLIMFVLGYWLKSPVQ